MPLRALAVLVVVLAAAVAWAVLPGGAPAAPKPSPPQRLAAGDVRRGAVPEPRGPVVLRVTGTIEGQRRASTRFDLATLDRLPQVRLTTFEPFRKQRATFTGVLVEDLLEVAGAVSRTR
jgi:hypothetical protein